MISIYRLTVGPFEENVWCVVEPEDRRAIIIDPGDEPTTIIDFVNQQHFNPVAVLNTHAHLDHIGAVHALTQTYNIPFYLHSSDAYLLEEYPEHAAMFNVPAREIPTVTHFLDDIASLNLAGVAVRVLHTPGHTPGGVSYLINGNLFAGDTLFNGSIGRTDLPGGNYNTLIRSINEKLLSLPDETIVHAGHGPDTTIGQERKANPFL